MSCRWGRLPVTLCCRFALNTVTGIRCGLSKFPEALGCPLWNIFGALITPYPVVGLRIHPWSYCPALSTRLSLFLLSGNLRLWRFILDAGKTLFPLNPKSEFCCQARSDTPIESSCLCTPFSNLCQLKAVWTQTLQGFFRLLTLPQCHDLGSCQYCGRREFWYLKGTFVGAWLRSWSWKSY